MSCAYWWMGWRLPSRRFPTLNTLWKLLLRFSQLLSHYTDIPGYTQPPCPLTLEGSSKTYLLMVRLSIRPLILLCKIWTRALRHPKRWGSLPLSAHLALSLPFADSGLVGPSVLDLDRQTSLGSSVLPSSSWPSYQQRPKFQLTAAPKIKLG